MFDSQCTQIIEYIKRHGSITHNDADREFGCKRLAARIADIKGRGYAIKSVMETGINRHQRKVRYARYSFEEVTNE